MSGAPTSDTNQWPRRSFPEAAKELLADHQTRANVLNATTIISEKRRRVVGELEDWHELREAAVPCGRIPSATSITIFFNSKLFVPPQEAAFIG
jgi:hypothetical protein